MAVLRHQTLNRGAQRGETVTDEYMIGLAARQSGNDAAVAMPALIASQCRLRRVIEKFDANTQAHSEALRASVDVSARETARLVGLTGETSAQTGEVIRLTKQLKWLTVAIGTLTLVQVAMAVFRG